MAASAKASLLTRSRRGLRATSRELRLGTFLCLTLTCLTFLQGFHLLGVWFNALSGIGEKKCCKDSPEMGAFPPWAGLSFSTY